MFRSYILSYTCINIFYVFQYLSDVNAVARQSLTNASHLIAIN